MLGDIILAEPGALIGFAGPRVIEQTIHQKLPEGFQRAEFQLDHGFVDQIVERKDQKKVLGRLLKLHAAGQSWKDWSEEKNAAGSGQTTAERLQSNAVAEGRKSVYRGSCRAGFPSDERFFPAEPSGTVLRNHAPEDTG